MLYSIIIIVAEIALSVGLCILSNYYFKRYQDALERLPFAVNQDVVEREIRNLRIIVKIIAFLSCVPIALALDYFIPAHKNAITTFLPGPIAVLLFSVLLNFVFGEKGLNFFELLRPKLNSLIPYWLCGFAIVVMIMTIQAYKGDKTIQEDLIKKIEHINE